MREGPALRSPEQLTNDPPGTFVGRHSELRSLAALGLLAPALILGGVSCAVGGVESPLAEGQAAAPVSDNSRYLITAAEVRSASTGTLYEVVQGLRPAYRRGPFDGFVTVSVEVVSANTPSLRHRQTSVRTGIVPEAPSYDEWTEIANPSADMIAFEGNEFE